MRAAVIAVCLVLSGCGTIDKGRDWLAEKIVPRSDYDMRLLCDVVGEELNCIKVN